MKTFEDIYKERIKQYNLKTYEFLKDIKIYEAIQYSIEMIDNLKKEKLEDKIKSLFSNLACHMAHTNLEHPKVVYLK